MDDFVESVGLKVLIEILAKQGSRIIDSTFKSMYSHILKLAKKKISNNDDQREFIENYNLEVSEDVIFENIKHNMIASTNWANEININLSLHSRAFNKIYIDIDLYLSPLSKRYDNEEDIEKISSRDILTNPDGNQIIYGGAGAGKTTLLKKIYKEISENYSADDFFMPMLIRFRDLDYDNHDLKNNLGLYKILSDLLGIKIEFPSKFIDLFKFEYSNAYKQAIISFLNEVNILLVFDGFDEIPTLELKKRFEKEFADLSISLKPDGSRFILTSRSNDFSSLNLVNTHAYEICPLNDHQIKALIGRWLMHPEKSDTLFRLIKDSPFYDTTMRPLTLSNLCAIYERKKTIPDKPRYVYDFVLKLLLEDWDQERGIIRPSNYANFYIEKKKDFLAHLAFWLTYCLSKNIFNRDDIRKCYNNVHLAHNLPKTQADKVVKELETHTGIFIQAGFDSYEFSHKSLQEFLAAKYLSMLPRIPNSNVILKLPTEMAITVCLSSDPNYYFVEFLKDINSYNDSFLNVFFTRLIEEKPDFTTDPAVLVFILQCTQKKRDKNAYKFYLSQLLAKTNLLITIKPFLKIYNTKTSLGEHIGYIHHKHNTASLAARNYFPGQLIIDIDVIQTLQEYK